MDIDKIYDVVKATNIENINNLIEKEDYLPIETLLFVIYDVYKYIPENNIIEEKIKRQYQYKFKKKLIKKYKQCIISNDDEDLCEAAHIIPYSESDLTNKYDVNNGLLLSSALHKMFDDYLFTIDKNERIILSNTIMNKKSYKNYHKYNKLQLNLNTETLTNLKTHDDKFIELNTIIN